MSARMFYTRWERGRLVRFREVPFRLTRRVPWYLRDVTLDTLVCVVWFAVVVVLALRGGQ